MSDRRDLALIWAQARGGVIGSGGDLPWYLPEDLAHFKRLTLGTTVLMGRRTWDSLPEGFRPLPGRRNVVVTRSPDWAAPGALRASSIDHALELAGPEPLWVIGGGELYRATIGRATVLEVTEVDETVTGDTFAPEIGAGWVGAAGPWLTSSTGLRYRFRRYRRGATSEGEPRAASRRAVHPAKRRNDATSV